MAITNLTGTTWQINDSLSVSVVLQANFDLTFTYKGSSTVYRSITHDSDSSEYAVWYNLYYGSLFVYEVITYGGFFPVSHEWQNQNYRTITITGGSSVTSQSAIDWFTNNATQLVTNYTVTFNVQGHGTAPAAQTVASGNKATKPTDPTASGYRFDGWYTESACTNLFDFNTAITSDRILYAKWVALRTISYSTAHGSRASKTVDNGYALNSSDISPLSAEGYRFDGWYRDSAYTQPATEGYVVNADLILYAKWSKLIYIGNDAVLKIFIGSNNIRAVFIGNNKVF